MKLKPLSFIGESDCFIGATPRLIDALGTADFEHRFFEVSRRCFSSAHVVALGALPGARAPRIILARNDGTNGIARTVAQRYTKVWQHDPVVKAAASLCRDAEKTVLIRPNLKEFAQASYRRQCYQPDDWIAHGSQIADRVTLARSSVSGMLVVHFFRHRRAGVFGEQCLDNLDRSASAIIALLSRHDRHLALNQPRQAPRSIGDMLPVIQNALPQLPPREAEVCAGISLGQSSEGIALELAISLNTVLTYRKRAYARLAISSQNELLKLVYPLMARRLIEAAF